MEEFWGEIPLGKEEKGVLREARDLLELLPGTGGLEFTGNLSSILRHQGRVNKLSDLPQNWLLIAEA